MTQQVYQVIRYGHLQKSNYMTQIRLLFDGRAPR